MLIYIFSLLLFIHGCIHLIGFARGFNGRVIPLLTQDITQKAGIFWFLAALVFFAAAVVVLLKVSYWWVAVVAAVLLSEVLIIKSWKDAGAGTYINMLILLAMMLLLFWK